ncbi:hypothetical protein PV05_06468 [Exophiala xenobiotica]|uniref:Uncharacterized protein n=1 Tax=Exophiala xenobiotica TaxID=348802 RepID=A0A0D2F2C8_9EURO|nr:uncharacterized protein PV05_06468 [Exophiala xenobiotica]KIW54079.1 hypothetical protein PV05_06468 [Exophiala xenobiotica]
MAPSRQSRLQGGVKMLGISAYKYISQGVPVSPGPLVLFPSISQPSSASTRLPAFSSRIQRPPCTLRSPLNNNWVSSLSFSLSHTAAFPGESLPSQNPIFCTAYLPDSNDFHHNTQDAYLLLACGTSSPGLGLVRAYSPHTRNWQRNIMRLRRQSLRRVLYPQ